MEFQQIIELVKVVSESKITTMEYKEGETKIVLKVESGQMSPLVVSGKIPELQIPSEGLTVVEKMVEQVAEQVAEGKSGECVISPLVGTFYSAASEEAEAFVKVGDKVVKGQTLAIVEAMKLMNEIESDYDGIVEEILVDNGQGVEYGQPLFVIK